MKSTAQFTENAVLDKRDYNPWPEEKRVRVVTPGEEGHVYDLRRKKRLQPGAGGVELRLGPFEAQVIELRK